MNKSPLWLPASHDFPVFLWETIKGWNYTCPERGAGGVGYATLEDAKNACANDCPLECHQGLEWIIYPHRPLTGPQK